MNTASHSTIQRRWGHRLYLTAEPSVQQRLEDVLKDALDHITAGGYHSVVSEPYEQVLSVDCDLELLHLLGSILHSELRRDELDQIACRLSHPSSTATTSELMNSARLSGLIDQLGGHWVRELIDQNCLLTYYQPIINAHDPSDVFGYECLTRGQAEGGLIAPYLLFDRARRAGMLNELDCAAFLTAVESIGTLDSQHQFLINVCPAVASSRSEEFHRMIDAAVSLLGNENQLMIEVTESERIENDDTLQGVLAEFRSSGIRLALDDVGSGYSSLALLAELQPELMKVDMSLVRGASSDPYRGCIVRKLIELAKELSISTVVEGVETVADWHWVQDQGVEYAQGFLFARPDGIPADATTIVRNTVAALTPQT